MSSPIASKKDSFIRRNLQKFHKQTSHVHRINVLSKEIAGIIDGLFPEKTKIKCMDIGCGDMEIAEAIGRLSTRTEWMCLDIYELPEQLASEPRWGKYMKFDGTHIPCPDNSWDVVLLCDVLHHARKDIFILLKESARVGAVVIVKDHFEYSLYSRFMLRMLDFLGNWGYGVSLPTSYFTKDSFKSLCEQAGVSIEHMKIGIDLYSHLPVIRFFLLPKWQFIAVLR